MKKLFFVIISVLVVGVTFHSCRKSYDPGDWNVVPTEFLDENEYTGPAKTLKVMSINMNLGSTPANFPTMVNVIKAYDPDLLLLRQCDSKTTRANGVDRPQEVADAVGMNLFFKGRSYGGGQFGNAVLSKFPITETLGVDLTKGSGGEQRMLAMIKVEVEDGVFLYFAGTELETIADDRLPQVIDILRVTQDLEDPLIFVGNFNEQERAPGSALEYLKGTFTFACPSTGCVFNSPKTTLTSTTDYITYQDPNGLLLLDKYAATFTQPESANNFYPVVAEFRIKLQE